MKKNGFTFIEILGVITLLALLSIIVLVTVDKSLKNSKNTLSDVQIENIKSAASMWRTDNIELIPDSGYYTITLGELIDLGYFKGDLVDPDNGSNYDRNLALGIGINDIKIDSLYNLLTRLEYIESTGTQYINLEYKAKTNTEVRLDIQFIPNSNTDVANMNNTVVGKEINDNKDATFQFNFGAAAGQKNQIYYWVDKIYGYGGVVSFERYTSVTNRSILIVKSGSATFQGVTHTIATKTADNTENMILLGGCPTDENEVKVFNRYDAKVYGFQIYEGADLIMDMVPMLRNGKAGLYDLVGNRFYVSAGIGDFLYGELE